MPFYEYECSACKYYLEVMQKISDAPLKKCPSCGKETLQRLISAPVFRLKGAGWYETDFKGDKENKRNLVSTGADDKEPAEKKSGDDKGEKTKVRVSKALKKAAGKKPRTSAKKPVKKKTAVKPATKTVHKPAKRPAKSTARGRKTTRNTRKPARKK